MGMGLCYCRQLTMMLLGRMDRAKFCEVEDDDRAVPIRTGKHQCLTVGRPDDR